MPAFATTPKTGTGTLTKCTMSGTVKFSPALTGTSRSTKTTIAVKVTCTAGTGDGATVTGGSSTGTETKSQSCSGLAGTTSHNIADTTTWTVKSGKPALAASKGALTQIKSNANTTTGVVSFDATGKVKTGSFSKSPLNDIAAHAAIKENLSTVVNECGHSGVSTLTIKPTSTFKIN
jgi:hypothetical protein